MAFEFKHLVTGEELSVPIFSQLLEYALLIKKDKLRFSKTLKHHCLALLFEKPSFRTRLSFTAAMQELGGQVMCIDKAHTKEEWPQDQIQVLQGYCQGLMIRTFTEHIFEIMLSFAKILNRAMQSTTSMPFIPMSGQVWDLCQMMKKFFQVFN